MDRKHLLKNIDNVLAGMTDEQLEKILASLTPDPDEPAAEEKPRQRKSKPSDE